MTTLLDERPDQDERTTFVESVRAALDDVWPSAVHAESGSLPAVRAVGLETGWFDLGEFGAIEFLVDLMRELGARACPLPVADAYVGATLFPDLAEAISSGEIRIVTASLSAGGADATHLLDLDEAAGQAHLRPLRSSEILPSLAAPALWRAAAGSPEHTTPLHADGFADAVAILRLRDASFLTAAARRAHLLAIEHAKTRRQFDRPIGAFGAVQQRIAACHIDVSASEALIDEAVSALAIGSPSRAISASLAWRHVADHIGGVVAGAQHTLGAVGYFDEHEAAWLFRSVHSGLTLARARERGLPASSRLAVALLAPDGSLPSFALGEPAEKLRAEVRTLLDAHRTADGFDVEELRADAAARGMFSLSWPTDEGGRGASLEEQVVLGEEMKYAGGPVDRAMSATMLIGHALLRHGTPEQKAEFLPLLEAGKMDFCLGYSEPEAGSDLASLRTRAVRDGDTWVITGQKLWTTRAHTASHVWLAVRTDPDAAPRHAGITIFLVPMDTPGIVVQQHRALSGEISCTVFYDEVLVPDSARVGELNGGWQVITDALAAERVVMGGIAATLLGHFDALLTWARAQEDLDPLAFDALCGDAARLQAARAFVIAATRAMSGDDARIVGPMAAVLSGDLAEHFARTALDLVGPESLVENGPLGRFESFLRLAPMYVIGGGTNDIQRGIIARSLGLRRE